MPKPRAEESKNAYLLDWCESEFRRYLYIPDPGFLYVLLGTIVANCFVGKPVWLMLVGPSGCGKTEALMAAAASDKGWFRLISDASKSAFLSGSSKRERTADATGGILKEIANKNLRFLVFAEYGTILAQSKDDYNQITSMQREIWDGNVNRSVGSDGGKMLTWSGKVGELAACTSRIDEVLAQEVACGVRWLLWRYPRSDGWQEALKASSSMNSDERREALSDAISSVISDAKLEWGMQPRQLSTSENIRITRLASFSSNLQGGITRDKYHREEVTELPSETYPTRLGPALSNIYLGMEKIGLAEPERWRQIRKIAFDTAPALRVAVLRAFANQTGNGRMDWSKLAEIVRCTPSTVMRQMEDLAFLHVVDRIPYLKGWNYRLPVATAEELKQL